MRLCTIYGGSFDPIHVGHVSMIRRAVALGYHVLIVPAFRHAFGKQSAPFEHRLRMCRLVLDASLQDHTRVCDVERRLADDDAQPVYTYGVLRHLRDRLRQPVSLLVGPDIAAEWQRWHRHADIDREFGRLSLPATHAVRSSDVRQQLRHGAPPGPLAGMIPETVAAYIAAQGLYRQPSARFIAQE
jgi:nicotinate-nucleotide adenylyltransferase